VDDFKTACTMQLDIKSLRLLYNIIKKAHEEWPPDQTDTPEMEAVTYMKSQLYAAIMEYMFREH
jgi:hypothetical protein